jgi:hypothetical protein
MTIRQKLRCIQDGRGIQGTAIEDRYRSIVGSRDAGNVLGRRFRLMELERGSVIEIRLVAVGSSVRS